MHRASVGLPLVACLVTSCNSGSSPAEAHRPETVGHGRPTVFARGQGEQLLMRGSRPLFIMADAATVGSRTLVAGYEDVPPGDSVRAHTHLGEDEIIFVHRARSTSSWVTPPIEPPPGPASSFHAGPGSGSGPWGQTRPDSSLFSIRLRSRSVSGHCRPAPVSSTYHWGARLCSVPAGSVTGC